MQKLAIIGAGYLQVPLVEKARAMGLETHCFAWAKGAVCETIADYFYPISITEKEEILEVCTRVGIDGILTIASDLAVTTVNYVAEKLHLTANPNQYTNIVTNKFAMRDCFDLNNISSPFYFVVNQDDEFFEDLRFPLIVKPTDRSGSLGVERVENCESLQKAIARAREISFAKEVIMEQFIEGQEVSVETISWQGKHYILAITDKVTTDNFFVEVAHHQPTTLDAETVNVIKDLTLRALTALHIENGASHTEIKITPLGELFVIEVGARMGGDFIGSHLVELSTGYDFLRGVIEVALGNFTPPMLKQQSCAGVYFLSKETEHLTEYICNAEKYPFIVQSEILDSELMPLRSSSDRSGYLIYKSAERIMLL